MLDKLEEKGHLVIRQKNTGLGAARNNSLLKASGEVVLFLDDDNDYWLHTSQLEYS